jgi:hypothetical protein
MAALTDPETGSDSAFSVSLAFVSTASFWAEAAVMAALTDPETGSDSSFSFSLLLWPPPGLRPQSCS